MLKHGAEHHTGVQDAIIRNLEACEQLTAITRTSLGPNGELRSPVRGLAGGGSGAAAAVRHRAPRARSWRLTLCSCGGRDEQTHHQPPRKADRHRRLGDHPQGDGSPAPGRQDACAGRSYARTGGVLPPPPAPSVPGATADFSVEKGIEEAPGPEMEGGSREAGLGAGPMRAGSGVARPTSARPAVN